MIVTPSCENLTIKSSILTGEGKNIASIVLRTKLNCSSTQTSVVLTSLEDDIVEDTLVIPATAYYNDASKTTYCDGVYNFSLAVTYTEFEDEAIFQATDTACVFIDCDTKCKVMDHYTLTRNTKIIHYYYALVNSADCDVCNCTDMCSLYTEIKTLLNDNSSTTSDDCGCS